MKMERSGAVLTELELYIRHQMRKGEWEDIPVPAGTQAVKYDMSDEDIVEMLSRIWAYSEDGTTQDMNGKNLESG
mgnify:CR=1 FL=1